MKAELRSWRAGRFTVLILDNEVTVGEFVASPPLPWLRLAQRKGVFLAAPGSPASLTTEHAGFEMTNWDEVSPPAIRRALSELDDGVDYVVVGNNAGQGLPLAQSLPTPLIRDRAAIIYARSLPERNAYERLGYRNFFRRSEIVAKLLDLANGAGQPLALSFVNTIQHNHGNYHKP